MLAASAWSESRQQSTCTKQAVDATAPRAQEAQPAYAEGETHGAGHLPSRP